MASRGRMPPLHLDLADWAADPVVGEVRGDEGEPITFVGWLGLISAVEQLRAGAPEDDQPDLAR